MAIKPGEKFTASQVREEMKSKVSTTALGQAENYIKNNIDPYIRHTVEKNLNKDNTINTVSIYRNKDNEVLESINMELICSLMRERGFEVDQKYITTPETKEKLIKLTIKW